MIKVKKEGLLLEKTALGFESAAVFNPAVYQDGDEVHLFYRAVRKGNFSTIGHCRLRGPLKVVERDKVPVIIPQHFYESQGIEDPRIVKVDGTALLDSEQPGREIARLPWPLFSPEEEWEKKGYVDNVVFPTGTAVFGDRLYIYYGAADSRIAVASLDMKELLNALLAAK